MNLYCAKCKENHTFSHDETERLVYALQAELGDVLCAPPLPSRYDPTSCLLTMLKMGDDQYAEWVDEMVILRSQED